jgi:hypothetical protein
MLCIKVVKESSENRCWAQGNVIGFDLSALTKMVQTEAPKDDCSRIKP